MLLRSIMYGGPLNHEVGQTRYCPRYHFLEIVSQYKQAVYDPLSSLNYPGAFRVHILVQHPKGHIPEEAKQTIDSLVYAVHRVVLYNKPDSDEVRELRTTAANAAIRSCEPLVELLLNSTTSCGSKNGRN